MRSIVSLLLAAICFATAGCSNESDQQTADALRSQAKQRANEQARLEDKLKETNAGTVPTTRPAQSEGIDESFARLDAQIPGKQGVAVGVSDPNSNSFPSVSGSLISGTAWSTAKLPVAMAAIAAGSGSEAQLRAAITASDNAAAETLWSGLGGGSKASAAANSQLRASGDNSTSVQAERIRPGYTPFGQTEWSLADQVRFVDGMDCTSQGRQVLELMGQIVPAQRWGLSNIGTDPRFKGGWGPGVEPGQDGPWMERQLGVVTVNGNKFAVAIASEGGSHDSGISALNQIADWLAKKLSSQHEPASGAC